VVELGGIDSQKTVRDIRLSRSGPWNQACVSGEYACVRPLVCIL